MMLEEMTAQLLETLPSLLDLDPAAVQAGLTRPPKPEMGDLAFPCFGMAKALGRSPAAISAEAAPRLNGAFKSKGIQVTALGPYLNFRFDRLAIASTLTKRALAGESLIRQSGAGQTVVIDFSSPNIAKPFSMGHLRSTSIGNSLALIYRALGWRVVRINHLGDWGTQFGKLITAYRLWGERERLDKEDISYLMELYIRFNDQAKLEPALDDQARAAFKELEDGDPEALELWEIFREASLREFNRIYQILGVEFDSHAGESFYNDKVADAIEKLVAAGITSESEGALVVRLGNEKEPPCMIRKSDGATTYAARDLAAVFYRWIEYSFDRMLYVVGAPQALHFRQVFGVVKKLDNCYADRCHHIPFGQILLEGEMMSTRRGNVIFLEDVIKEAEARALEKMLASQEDEETRAETDELKLRARTLAVSSIIFFDLKNGRIKDVDFSWDEILNPHGETGIYLQYAHARIHGIMRKFSERTGLAIEEIRQNPPEIHEEGAWPIYDSLIQLSDKVNFAAENNEPSVISRWLLDLAAAFSTYYRTHKVINEDDPELSRERMAVVLAAQEGLSQGLRLLGITPLERM